MVAGLAAQGDRRVTECNGSHVSKKVNDLSLTRLTASCKELNDVAVRIRRSLESGRNTIRRSDDRSGRTSRSIRRTRNEDSRVNRLFVKTVVILLVRMISVSKTDTEPASREDPQTGDSVDRIVLECIRSAATNISLRSKFEDRLEVFVYREINTDTCVQFRTGIKQGETSTRELALNATGPGVAKIGREVRPSRESSSGKQGHVDVTPVRTGACSTLKLIESAKVARVIGVPFPRSDNTCTDRVIDPRPAPFHTTGKGVE